MGEEHTHLIAAGWVSWGPSQDSPQFTPVIRQAAKQIQRDRVIADTAYDGEHNHVLCREKLGIRSTVIPLNRRNHRKWPPTHYRRQVDAYIYIIAAERFHHGREDGSGPLMN